MGSWHPSQRWKRRAGVRDWVKWLKERVGNERSQKQTPHIARWYPGSEKRAFAEKPGKSNSDCSLADRIEPLWM